MSAQHTPGPWTSHVVRVQRAIVGRHGEPVAYTRADLERDDVDEANARLIAAAPELLEALLHCVRFWDLFVNVGVSPEASTTVLSMPEFRLAKAAIAKATGSTS